MANLILPRRFTQQPQCPVYLTPEAASEHIILAAPGGFGAREIITGIILTPTGAASLSAGAGGVGYSSTGGGTDEYEGSSASAWAVGTTNFTVEVLLSMTAAPSLSCPFGVSEATFPSSGGTAGKTRGLLTYPNTPGNIYFWGGNRDLDSGVAWRVDGSIQHVFVVANGSTMTFYRDGRQIAQGATPALAAFTSTRYFAVGGRHSSGAASPTQKLYKGAILNRPLSAAEVKERTLNPWQIFRAKPRVLYFDVAAGGTTTVSSDLGDSYGLRSDVSGDLADSYLLRSGVSADLGDSYLLRNTADSDLADSYALRANVASDYGDSYILDSASSVGSDLADAYEIRAAVSGDLADAYALRSNIDSDLADSYDIASASSVASDLGDGYFVRAAVSGDLGDSYALRSVVAGDLEDAWLLRAGVAAEFLDLYSTRNFVSGDIGDSYLSAGLVYSDLADVYAIDGDLHDRHIGRRLYTVPPENRLYTVPRENRIYTVKD